jgi:hypothetical protein
MPLLRSLIKVWGVGGYRHGAPPELFKIFMVPMGVSSVLRRFSNFEALHKSAGLGATPSVVCARNSGPPEGGDVAEIRRVISNVIGIGIVLPNLYVKRKRVAAGTLPGHMRIPKHCFQP